GLSQPSNRQGHSPDADEREADGAWLQVGRIDPDDHRSTVPPSNGGQDGASNAAPSSIAPAATPTPTIQASPGVQRSPLPGLSTRPYVTGFQPKVTVTIVDEVEDGCAAGFRCR